MIYFVLEVFPSHFDFKTATCNLCYRCYNIYRFLRGIREHKSRVGLTVSKYKLFEVQTGQNVDNRVHISVEL